MVGFVWIDFESIVFALPILAEMTYTWHGQWTEFTCRKCDVRLAKNVIFDLIMHTSIMINYFCIIFFP